MRTFPASTYRLQFRGGVDFDTAAQLTGYLSRLGIEWLYASPLLEAAKGSTHGYDVVDPTVLDPALGGAEAFGRMVAALRAKGMGLLVDIVPNHMRGEIANPWWRDQLEHGLASRYANFFDIRWSIDPEGRLVLPVLGEHFGEVLENAEFKLDADDHGLVVRYHEHAFPLDPATWAKVLQRCEGADPAASDLVSACFELPPRVAHPDASARRAAQTPQLREMLRRLRGRPAFAAALEEQLARLSGRKGEPSSFDELDALLDDQAYRLTHWRSGLGEINYRRFFDISELVAMRTEVPEVFDEIHRYVLELIQRGDIHGLRIDHIDGLADPQAYLQRLREGGVPYVVVEKILIGDEALPEDWAADGTTGYDFIAACGPLFVDPVGWIVLEAEFRYATGYHDLEHSVADAKRQALRERFWPAVQSLAADLRGLTVGDRRARDVSQVELEQALGALTVATPVYRTYARAGGLGASDRATLEIAIERARGVLRREEHCALDFIARVVLGELEGSEERRSLARAFVRRWQQLTGPVMAKGVEDTAFYRYVPLIALNEVGAHPEVGSDALQDFFRWATQRTQRCSHGLNLTASHDTKRGEDTRARLYAVSEYAGLYRKCRDACGRTLEIDPRSVVEREELELLVQTVLGAYPFEASELDEFRTRLDAYLIKAAREAKRRTSWLSPNEQAEQQILDRSHRLLDALHTTAWGRRVLELQRKIAFVGAMNGLAQTLIKVAAPGVVDVYRGTETWDLSLVDPDNRRPVDFEARGRQLEELEARRDEGAGFLEELRADWKSGRIKTHVLRRALAARSEFPRLFVEGDALGVEVDPRVRDALFTMARRREGSFAIAVAARRVAKLVGEEQTWPIGPVWGEARLHLPESAPLPYVDVLTGTRHEADPSTRHLQLAEVLAHLPVALLVQADARPEPRDA